MASPGKGGGNNAAAAPAVSAAQQQQPAAAANKGSKRPHELIPQHVKDRDKIEARKALMRAAAAELGELRSTLEGEAWSVEVLCTKVMKRKTLYCCKTDPDKPDRRALRPLEVLCEAKVSAASPTFIKCSCESCTGGSTRGARLHAGGSFNSVSDFLAHGRSVFGPQTIVVLGEVELSWPEVLDLCRLDPTDHLWYCLFCEETIPSAPLRTCDGCQLACHGACYVRAYGQPLAPGSAAAAAVAAGASAAGKGVDTRVLCVSCQEPELQTMQALNTVKVGGSKAGTARYTVPPLPHEVFRRETNVSHFDKGTYDFWGPTQARLMDALVFDNESPEAAAAAQAMAAAEAAAAEAEAAAAAGGAGAAGASAAAGAGGGDGSKPDDAKQQQKEGEPADGAPKANGAAAAAVGANGAAAAEGNKGGDKQQGKEKGKAAAASPAAAAASPKPAAAAAAAAASAEKAKKPAADDDDADAEPPRDPSHKATHVLIVRDPAGRLLTIPYEHGKNHKTHGPNRKLWVIKLMEQLGLQQGDLLVATKEPFEFKPYDVRQREQELQQKMRQPDGPWRKVLDRCDNVLQLHIIRKAARNAAAQAHAAAAGRGGGGRAGVGAAGRGGGRGRGRGFAALQQQQPRPPSRASGISGGFDSGRAPAGASLWGAMSNVAPGHGKRSAAAAFQSDSDALAAEAMGKPGYKIVQQQLLLQQQQMRFAQDLERQRRMQDQQQQQQQHWADDDDGDEDYSYEGGSGGKAASGGGRGSRGGRGSGGRGRGRGRKAAAAAEYKYEFEEDDLEDEYAAAEVAAALGTRASSKRRQSGAAGEEQGKPAEAAQASTQASAGGGAGGGDDAAGGGDAAGTPGSARKRPRRAASAAASPAPAAASPAAAAAAAAGAGGGGGDADAEMADAQPDDAAAATAGALQRLEQLRSSNQQLRQDLSGARQHIQSLQQQLQAALRQRDAAEARSAQLVRQMEDALGDGVWWECGPAAADDGGAGGA